MVDVDAGDLAEAIDNGFRQDTAEKVHRLIGVLREMQDRTDTSGKFTLKGGTALNIFHLEGVPRLSVDIDIIATGFPEAAARSAGRDAVIQLVDDVVKRLGYKTTKNDSEDSGCTIHCTYKNTLGTQDRIKIDIDIIGRQTILLPEEVPGPAMFLAKEFKFPTVARAELFAQKLVAVAYRAHARDLYDMHRMIGEKWHERERAKALYLAQSFLKDHEWYRLDYPVKLDVPYKPELLEDVLRQDENAPTLDELRAEARAALHPNLTVATPADQAERAKLLEGDLDAFARIAGEVNPERRKLLAVSPALTWRLQQARGRK